MSQQPTNDFTPPQSGDGFFCESVFGTHTQKPYVTLTVLFDTDRRAKMMSPSEARALALNLLECAEAADMDAMVIHFLQARLHLQLEKAAQIIFELREFRDETNKP